MFELYQLEQLLVVEECGTLSGAAEQLHLSQSALSRSMQRLEKEIQVPLFIRHKNKIELNENGELAVRYAKRIVDQTNEMINGIRDYDRKRRTIFVGSCAPAPLWKATPALSDLYPDMTISSEIRDSGVLLEGLREERYQLVILPYPVEEEGIFCMKYEEEHLFFSLPPAHPLSGSKALRLEDLNGETMLLRSQLGFWEEIIHEKMPDTKFLVQEDMAFDELVKASALPSFNSDLVIRREGSVPNRILVPIADEEVNVTYYCCCTPKGRSVMRKLFGC
ncbi:MAG TPA: LysR family transcriptional regulator [Candidatus Blautia gallistercoris]|uniref:LysR family transcriptional regulator n=1 Tax=Candidatus Blautia gallistercoris TaxID=2838490 RepID=A0A9D1WII9_9FIRM|nr:LysR family transcriptional regulator [Candidatus Blautia gallistercoris]